MGSVHEYGSLSDLSTSWERHLRPEVSPRTLESYLRAVTQFAAYLEIQAARPRSAPSPVPKSPTSSPTS